VFKREALPAAIYYRITPARSWVLLIWPLNDLYIMALDCGERAAKLLNRPFFTLTSCQPHSGPNHL